MTAQDFAKALRASFDEHEHSWNKAEQTYIKSWSESVAPYFEENWRLPAEILLLSGFADVWDWADKVDPVNATTT